MLKFTKSLLMPLLKIIAVITCMNVIALYWFPLMLPFSSFLAVKIMFVAYAEEMYYMSFISISICILMFFTAVSINRHKFLCPAVLTVYFAVEFLDLLLVLIDDFSVNNGFIWLHLVQILISTVLSILLCIYCGSWWKRKQNGWNAERNR